MLDVIPEHLSRGDFFRAGPRRVRWRAMSSLLMDCLVAHELFRLNVGGGARFAEPLRYVRDDGTVYSLTRSLPAGRAKWENELP